MHLLSSILGDNFPIVLLFISFHTLISSAAYDWRRPYQTENFDPAEADPLGNITCLGDSYPLDLPVQGNFNPNEVSMQILCAKPQYNGGRPGQHAGGFCMYPAANTSRRGDPLTPNNGAVGFDTSDGAQVNTILANPRVLLACSYKCFCNEGLTDLSAQPVNDFLLSRTHQVRSQSSYQLELDIVDDFSVPLAQKNGRLGDTRVDGITVGKADQIDNTLTRNYRLPQQQVSLEPANDITCNGDLPSFPLPAPFGLPSANFTNLQEMCANQLSGGSQYVIHSLSSSSLSLTTFLLIRYGGRKANAGGYCHRSNGNGIQQSVVWFSDEMTPRYDWTWEGSLFFGAAAIRFWCWRGCVCTMRPSKDTTTIKLWKFVYDHELLQNDDGSMTAQQKSQPSNSQQVLPPQTGPDSSAGTCGPDGKQFCSSQWPSDYGPIPQRPPYMTNVFKSPSTSNANLTVCGNKCNGPQDCVPSNGIEDCNCAVPSPDDARTLGFDPVFPVAVCLVLLKQTTNKALNNINVRSRDLGASYLDTEGLPYQCRCNQTFTAEECCGSKDGIVWLS